MRALLANVVTGVTAGFEETEITGVGYKADVRGGSIVLNLGYSHPITPLPDGIQIAVDSGTRPRQGHRQGEGRPGRGEIRSMRPPAYKGKGVRYAGEYIRLKAGKSGQK